MPRKPVDGVRIHVMITKRQQEKLAQLSAKSGLNMSELLRRAIDAYISKAREEK